MAGQNRVTKAFGLTGADAWRRHANPWSVYTRIPVPLLLTAAVWSRAWIGWWSLLPVAAVVVWTMVNPRVFPPPQSIDTWASRGTSVGSCGRCVMWVSLHLAGGDANPHVRHAEKPPLRN